MLSQTSRPTRGQALEEFFFYQVDRELSSLLLTGQQRQDRCQAISRATGIYQDDLVERLIDAGFDETTIDAIQCLPHVAVAWADGSVSQCEKDAVLEISQANGIDPSSAAYQKILEWLKHRPAESLFRLWVEYARATRTSLTPFWQQAMARELAAQTERVAKAAGGILGVAAVCPEERQVIQQVRDAISKS